jgi:hypothetical protein
MGSDQALANERRCGRVEEFHREIPGRSTIGGALPGIEYRRCPSGAFGRCNNRYNNVAVLERTKAAAGVSAKNGGACVKTAVQSARRIQEGPGTDAAQSIAAAVGQQQNKETGNGNSTYSGSCFCGAVQFTVTGEPAAMGIAIAIRAESGRRGP